MHIALVIPSLRSGGAERVMSSLANHWAEKDETVSLITLVPIDEKPFYPLHPKVKLIQLGYIHAPGDILLKRVWTSLIRILKLRKTLKSLNPDVILSFMVTMNITTLLATTGLKLPVLVSERTHPRYRLPLGYSRIRDLIYRRANRVIVQTSEISAYYLAHSTKKVSVIPNPVSIPREKRDQSTSLNPVKRIISIGRLRSQKRFDLLIEAFAEVATQKPDLRLMIYGEGKERTKLEEMIRQKQVSSQVDLAGVTKNVIHELCHSDLFVFPSRLEGFPNALAEAMSVGLPVIAANTSGNNDLVRDQVDGRLFDVDDLRHLSSILKELIDEPEQRERLAQNALDVSIRFSEKKVFDAWDQTILECSSEENNRIQKA